MKKYYQTADLKLQINWRDIMPMPRYAGGHDEQMEGLFREAKLIAHWNEEDYDGMVATCVKLKSGEYAIYNDYYGSCSGCDAWEDASDEEVKTMCEGLANGAYVFNTIEDVKEFLSDNSEENREGNYSWFDTYAKCAENLLNKINQTP